MWLVSFLASASAAEISVAVDRRVELLSQVFRLAAAEEYRRAKDTAYVRAADGWFARCEGHAAVRAVAGLRAKHGVGYDAPAKLAVHLDPLTLAPMASFARIAQVDARWEPTATKRFVGTLQAFAKACDLDGFLAQEKATIAAVEGRWSAFAAERDFVGWFASVLGPAQGATWTLHPGMLAGPNNYGVSFVRADGTTAFEPVFGLAQVDADGLPVLGEGVEGLVVHELAHAAVAPLLAPVRVTLEPAGDALFLRHASRMRAQAYGDGWTVVNETVVRAFSVLYARDHHGDAGADAALAREVGQGFGWLPDVVRVLEAARTREGGVAAALAELGPVLAAWVDGNANAPFAGPINNVFDGPWVPDRLVVVRPAGTSPSVRAAAAYATAIHARFSAPKGVLLAAADQFVERAPIGQILYGSPASNPALGTMLGRLGWVVARDSVSIGGRTFTGEGLVLVACAPHPDDPLLPVLVYATADDAWVDGVNSVFHGPTDWLVARRGADGKFEAVAKGDW